MYKELGLDEIVMKTDEVLSQNAEWGNFNETEQQDRDAYNWAGAHAYAGLAVKGCKGFVTGRQRVFRRRLID